jgi:hypothetical protein
MNKRKYHKKDQLYWGNLGKKSVATTKPSEMLQNAMQQDPKDLEPSIDGRAYYKRKTMASDYVRNPRDRDDSSFRSAKLGVTKNVDEYTNIANLALPFDYDKGHVDITEAIELCQKAYFHIPTFRNTMDLLADMSNAPLVVEGKNENSKAFVKKWLEVACIDNIKEQYFRELYRSGNIFMYRMEADFSAQELEAMRKIYSTNMFMTAASEGKSVLLPVRYKMLNPSEIVNHSTLGLGEGVVYKKLLTSFEMERLRVGETEEEQKAFEALDPDTQMNIKRKFPGSYYMPIDSSKLIPSFYKKQDYEPFAIPVGYSVLGDINWKMELKNIDKAVSRTVENIILLVTAGTSPDKGGINANNLKILKELFSSESVGRVLVADYTTKAEFIIPDINKILGKEKYEIVNQDIKEGLQNILFDDTRYSDNDSKIQIFMDRLKEGRRLFLQDFLNKEIKIICSRVGFREYPTVKFDDSVSFNKDQMSKIAIRLMELGVMTPESTIEAMRSNKLPDPKDIEKDQKDYVEKRKEGLYTPLIGSLPLPLMEAEQAAAAASAATPTAIPKKVSGRPSGKASVINQSVVSKEKLVQVASARSEFEVNAEKIYKTVKKLKKLDDSAKSFLASLCSSIVEASEKKEWETVLKDILSGKGSLKTLETLKGVSSIASEFDISLDQASLIYHSRQI